MKLIQISAASSNSGKTISTMILGRILRNRGLDVRSFKCGPDYIDSDMLAQAFKSQKSNIDIHLMGYEGIKKAIAINHGQCGILEGAMGYFDGMGRGYDYSAYDIAKSLDINTVLVYQQKGEMFTMVPKIKGMVDFSKGRIKGIIFANMTPMMYSYVKEMIEENIDIKVLGYIAPNEDLKIESKNLGLDWEFKENFEKILDKAVSIAKETLDIDGFIDLMKEVEITKDKALKKTDIRLGIARDEAFRFFYGENQRILEENFQVEYFSPLKDKTVPDVDFLIFPGGYIEDFREELSKNTSMMDSVRAFHKERKPILAESGGMLYMTKELIDTPMCGIFEAKGLMNKRLQNFGYVNVELKEDSFLGKKGDIFPAHEYHYSSVDTELEPIFKVEKASGTRAWEDGYRVGNSIFSYQHINFAGNEKIIDNIIEFIKEQKCI